MAYAYLFKYIIIGDTGEPWAQSGFAGTMGGWGKAPLGFGLGLRSQPIASSPGLACVYRGSARLELELAGAGCGGATRLLRKAFAGRSAVSAPSAGPWASLSKGAGAL